MQSNPTAVAPTPRQIFDSLPGVLRRAILLVASDIPDTRWIFDREEEDEGVVTGHTVYGTTERATPGDANAEDCPLSITAYQDGDVYMERIHPPRIGMLLDAASDARAAVCSDAIVSFMSFALRAEPHPAAPYTDAELSALVTGLRDAPSPSARLRFAEEACLADDPARLIPMRGEGDDDGRSMCTGAHTVTFDRQGSTWVMSYTGCPHCTGPDGSPLRCTTVLPAAAGPQATLLHATITAYVERYVRHTQPAAHVGPENLVMHITGQEEAEEKDGDEDME